MASSQNNIQNSQPIPQKIQEKSNPCEDEINLIDYLMVIWKRKYFIVIGSVLPALVVALVISSWPRSYQIDYIYDVNTDEQSCKALLDGFHSAENLDKLTAKLKENKLDKYAQKIARGNVRLTVSNTSLTMSIVGRPQKDMQRISLVVRDNFEKVIPIYSIKKKLSSDIAKFKAEMADIEENKFSLELELEKKKAILIKLKDLEPADSNKIPGNIILQFDNISENSEYLPLAYQIQITDANIINIEETIRANQEKYDYYKSLISLNERLFDEVKNKTSSYYTIQEFHSFLISIINDYEDRKLVDYLNAYIKKIENVTSRNIPVVEKPSAYPIPKDTLKKTGIVFVALFIITIFGALLIENIKKSQAPAS